MSEYNIKINKGTDFSRTFALSESSVAIDIAGYTFEGTLKERYTSTQSTSFTMSIVDNALGLIQSSAIRYNNYLNGSWNMGLRYSHDQAYW